MAIVKCPQGHFFDSEKYSECPHCRNMVLAGQGDPDDDMRYDRTVAQRKRPIAPSSTKYSSGEDALDHTISIFNRGQSKSSAGLPVGWLVCVDGPEKGRDCRLMAGRNFAGRSPDMDICLSGDTDIHQNSQFSVVYDPRSNSFSLVPGNGASTYLNGKAITSSCPLSEWDKISAGQSVLIFRSFCGRDFTW